MLTEDNLNRAVKILVAVLIVATLIGIYFAFRVSGNEVGIDFRREVFFFE